MNEDAEKVLGAGAIGSYLQFNGMVGLLVAFKYFQ